MTQTYKTTLCRFVVSVLALSFGDAIRKDGPLQLAIALNVVFIGCGIFLGLFSIALFDYAYLLFNVFWGVLLLCQCA